MKEHMDPRQKEAMPSSRTMRYAQSATLVYLTGKPSLPCTCTRHTLSFHNHTRTTGPTSISLCSRLMMTFGGCTAPMTAILGSQSRNLRPARHLHAAHDDLQGLDGGHDERGRAAGDDAALRGRRRHAAVRRAVGRQAGLVRRKAQAVGDGAAHLRRGEPPSMLAQGAFCFNCKYALDMQVQASYCATSEIPGTAVS